MEDCQKEYLISLGTTEISGLEFSRQSARDFDDEKDCRIDLLLFNIMAKRNGCVPLSASFVQDVIERNWETIKEHFPDREFPYIQYDGRLLGTKGQTTRIDPQFDADTSEKERAFATKVLEKLNNSMMINPFSLYGESSEKEPCHVLGDDVEAHILFTFTHELRHLEQYRTGRLESVGFDQLKWEGNLIQVNQPEESYIGYLNQPHELDANTTALTICTTLQSRKKVLTGS